MIKTITNLFKRKEGDSSEKYTGFSDFFIRASSDEKREVITEAARRANADQLEVFEKARIKIKTN